MIQPQDICVVIPAYNEGSVIAEVVGRVRNEGFAHILVVNDGSSDDTAAQAERAGAVVISHLVNRGAGAGAQTGIQYARLNGIAHIVQIDADGQHFPEDIRKLAEVMDQEQADIVIGSRFMSRNKDIPMIRVLYNKLSNVFTNWFCTRWYSDTQSGFRMLNRVAIESLDLHIDGFGYCSEMIILGEKSGLIIREVPIRVAYTAYSMSKGQDLYMGINTAMNILWKLVSHPK